MKLLENFWFDPGGERFLVAFGMIAVAILLGIILNAIGFRLVDRIARRTTNVFDDLIPRYGRKPGRLLVPLLFLNFLTPSLPLPPQSLALYEHAIGMLLIGAGTYFLINMTSLLSEGTILRFARSSGDELENRKIITQVRVLERITIAVLLVFAAAFILMTFDRIRSIGVSILASAGVAGVILGIAAQKSLGTLLAGFQIAITQPIRLGDAVIVEGEWGTIEEISLTYVIVKIWDLRRLVLPITYFIEKPFQNWTRTSSQLLGSVFLYTDYTIPVDAVREELQRIVQGTPLWDGQVCGLQVTDCKANSIELRCIVSAANASGAWDLRCYVREKLIAYVQRSHPESLPRTRAELDSLDRPLQRRGAPTKGREEVLTP